MRLGGRTLFRAAWLTVCSSAPSRSSNGVRSCSARLSRSATRLISSRSCVITPAAACGTSAAVFSRRVIGASSAAPSVARCCATAACSSQALHGGFAVPLSSLAQAASSLRHSGREMVHALAVLLQPAGLGLAPRAHQFLRLVDDAPLRERVQRLRGVRCAMSLPACPAPRPARVAARWPARRRAATAPAGRRPWPPAPRPSLQLALLGALLRRLRARSRCRPCLHQLRRCAARRPTPACCRPCDSCTTCAIAAARPPGGWSRPRRARRQPGCPSARCPRCARARCRPRDLALATGLPIQQLRVELRAALLDALHHRLQLLGHLRQRVRPAPAARAAFPGAGAPARTAAAGREQASSWRAMSAARAGDRRHQPQHRRRRDAGHRGAEGQAEAA